jgi:hypothetical protein
MEIDLFERIKSVLVNSGWQYFFRNDLWTTQKTMDGVFLTNEALVSIMNSNSAGSIGFFFTYVLKKPDVLKDIFELLPDSFFGESGLSA